MPSHITAVAAHAASLRPLPAVQHYHWPMLSVSSVQTFFSAITFALTLLLVFKTNSSYSRCEPLACAVCRALFSCQSPASLGHPAAQDVEYKGVCPFLAHLLQVVGGA
jgi:hypothetical protein